MSEIKDVNKLVIKNSATIELERRKGFVNILLQGNPNLYRAWVERNNKIVIDISGESTEYNLDTETPDYIEIVKNQSDNKYYINFVGSITGDGNLVSDDITFSQEGDNTRLTIKSSKFVSTSKIKSGTPDSLYVNVDESGNVRIGLTQDVLQTLYHLNEWIEDTGVLIKEMKILNCEMDNNGVLTFETNLNTMDCLTNIIVLRRAYGVVLNGNNIVVSDLGLSPAVLNVVSNVLKPDFVLETADDMAIFSEFFSFSGFEELYSSRIDVKFNNNDSKVYLKFFPLGYNPPV